MCIFESKFYYFILGVFGVIGEFFCNVEFGRVWDKCKDFGGDEFVGKDEGGCVECGVGGYCE